MRIDSQHFGAGTITSQSAATDVAANFAGGAVTTLYGSQSGTENLGAGHVGNQYGVSSLSLNYSSGSVDIGIRYIWGGIQHQRFGNYNQRLLPDIWNCRPKCWLDRCWHYHQRLWYLYWQSLRHQEVFHIRDRHHIPRPILLPTSAFARRSHLSAFCPRHDRGRGGHCPKPVGRIRV